MSRKQFSVNFIEGRHRRGRSRSRVVGVLLLLGLSATAFGVYELNQKDVALAPLSQGIVEGTNVLRDPRLLSTLLGLHKPFTVLLLFQNSGELRPTGGFIGTVGVLTIENAHVKQFWTDDVYRLDGYALEHGPIDTPPDPIVRYLRVHDWGIRDANWDPDFPSAAKLVVARFIERLPALSPDRAVSHIDAVVAVTPELIDKALGVLGPIELEGRTFTKDNLTDTLQEFVEVGYKQAGIAPHERKGIIGRMAHIMLERIAKDYTLLPQLVPVASAAVQAKDLQAFAFDDALEHWIAIHGAQGSLPESAGHDSLGVFDTNLASFKTDTVMDRSITYTLQGRNATVTLRYVNHGAFTWKTTRYRTYTRVYVPLGSRLIEVRGALEDDKTKNPRLLPGTADVSEEHGYRVFGAFTAIEPQHSGTLSFTYELPESVVSGPSYGLTLIKQAGTGSVPLTIDLKFGKTIERAEPASERSDGDTYVLKGRFDRDQHVGVQFAQ